MTVYAVQEPCNFDTGKERWLPRVNIYNASDFGDVEVLIPGSHVHAALVPVPTLHKMRAALRHYGDNDYLLPVGDPTLVAMAAMLAAKENRGHVKLLRWNRQEKRYDVVEVSL